MIDKWFLQQRDCRSKGMDTAVPALEKRQRNVRKAQGTPSIMGNR
jgi:hypothetical protein